MQKPIILFDLDGTLIDSTKCIVEAFKFAFKKEGIAPPKQSEITAHIGYTLGDIFAFLGIESSKIENMVANYKSRYQEIYLDGTILLDYAKEAVLKANEFANLGVVTTKTSKYSRLLLENLGIAQYFQAIVGREDVLNPKPDKEPIIKALQLINKDSRFKFMVGDTKLDALAAKSAGIKGVGVLCGYGKEKELNENFDYVVKNSFKAVKLIKNLVFFK
ncbi:MAG: HAD family hydrolase [Campylobacter sp.]|nr:HAD family hydrolase [Campylobacter sp.]